MKSLAKRIAAPSLKLVSFCTCDCDRALCPSCCAPAQRQRCRICGGPLLSCEAIDGETFHVCPNCIRCEPANAS